MGNIGRVKSAASQHGSLVAVVAVALVGVMIYASLTTESLAASPGAPTTPIVTSGANDDSATEGSPGPGASADPPSKPGASSGPGFLPDPLGSPGSADGSSTPVPEPDGTLPPPEVSPPPVLGDLPVPALPPGTLGPLQQIIDLVCVTAFTPFGLPDTVFGLLGGGIPITLPNVPFQILIEPISELCVALQSLATQ